VHPLGAELVVCVAGSITLHQEIDDATVTTTLTAGEAVINEPGVWHTADVVDTATVLFVTAGAGIEVRLR
jgi:quercetin dioxygenase-like cupin family protein